MEEKIELSNSNNKILVTGAGGWGTALAVLLTVNGNNVSLWTHEENVITEIKNNRTNETYLPGVKLPASLTATNSPAAFDEASIIVNTVPVQYIRSIFENREQALKGKVIINGSKGIERGSLNRVYQIFQEVAGLSADNYAVLSGPSHAEEVSRNVITAVMVASYNPVLAAYVQKSFSNSYFRVYTSNDIIGAEIGGALKNVIAVAAGIIDGLEMGDNTKAALMTRGLAELSRLGITLGANPLTFSGLSGLGDLIVTCNSRHSRNRYIGEQIGRGKEACDVISSLKSVAEGVFTAESAYLLGKKYEVELPICKEMYDIIFHSKNPKAALKDLMARGFKHETH